MFENITAPRPRLETRFILSVATAYAPLGLLFSVHPDRFAPELARLLQFTLALLVYIVSTDLFAPRMKGEWVHTTVLHAGASAAAGSVLVLFAAWVAARTPLGRAPDPSHALDSAFGIVPHASARRLRPSCWLWQPSVRQRCLPRWWEVSLATYTRDRFSIWINNEPGCDTCCPRFVDSLAPASAEFHSTVRPQPGNRLRGMRGRPCFRRRQACAAAPHP